MKQHITARQSIELTNEQWKKWIGFWMERDRLFINPEGCEECGRKNLPTIGEMIEFLSSENVWPELSLHKTHPSDLKKRKSKTFWRMTFGNSAGHREANELCDILWETIKEILKK